MAELPPNSAPEDPQQSSAPNGWELVCVGILRSGFGRFRSHALDKAMMRLSAEQAWREDRAGRMKWWQQIRGAFSHPGFAFAMGTSLLLVMAAAWIFFTTEREQHVNDAAAICRIGETLDAKWAAGFAQLMSGEKVPSKSLRLESGVVELNFASGAQAAIQGPVEFRVLSRNSILLEQGELSAEVPRQARGFTVKTANATTTDLGTRFGINAKSDGSSETDVFQGKVHVANRHDANTWDLTHDMAVLVDANGGTLTAAASEASFPQLAHVVMVRPANCSFDEFTDTNLGGFPSSFGVWSGPAFTLTGPVEGVRPAQGRGMLRFLAPGKSTADGSADSVVWQLIDLRPARNFIAEYGTVDLKASGHFNRVAGGAHAATRFRLTIAAFRGSPVNAPTLWGARTRTALAVGETNLDSNPGTWEKIEAATSVTADADFAVIEIRAIAPKDAVSTSDPFPGNFADTIEAKVCLPLRPSTLN